MYTIANISLDYTVSVDKNLVKKYIPVLIKTFENEKRLKTLRKNYIY